MTKNIRTDLAMEAHEALREDAGDSKEINGVRSREYEKDGCHITNVEVLTEEGEKALGKPRGRYITLELHNLVNREYDAFTRAVSAISDEIKSLFPENFHGPVLLAGLGNRHITPDSIGPKTVDYTMVTRHLVRRKPETFGNFREVAAIAPGVLGLTGMETGEIIEALCGMIRPSMLLVVDALASRKLSRLCTTVQITDTGIVPGSGVGNSRNAIDQNKMGIPVIAMGVPTVVDAATLAADILEESGAKLERFSGIEGRFGQVIVTPKEIDSQVSDIAKAMGYGINHALHEGITVEDIDMFLS